MGGLGSGRRYRYDAADCTDDYRRLDVRRWQRDGFLTPGRAFGWQWTRQGEIVASIQVRAETDRVILNYRHRSGGKEWKDEKYSVRLDWTACTYGGRRAWFLCPAVGCGLRVAILYGGGIFACRHCHRLAYPSQRETDDDRATRQADKIRERLGWEPGILNGEGGKPKGMRWRTFRRLSVQHNIFVNESLAGAMRRFGIKIDI
ncbi:MAG: hypothetical protein HHJ12_18295 [Glaciimonas sp.]|nr:hypothetical protein [Glaciimonas sp.]